MGPNDTAYNEIICGRKEAIMHAEKQRHNKYKKQEEERENVRQNLRDKVRGRNYQECLYFVFSVQD